MCSQRSWSACRDERLAAVGDGSTQERALLVAQPRHRCGCSGRFLIRSQRRELATPRGHLRAFMADGACDFLTLKAGVCPNFVPTAVAKKLDLDLQNIPGINRSLRGWHTGTGRIAGNGHDPQTARAFAESSGAPEPGAKALAADYTEKLNFVHARDRRLTKASWPLLMDSQVETNPNILGLCPKFADWSLSGSHAEAQLE